jgi:hypothetical protein
MKQLYQINETFCRPLTARVRIVVTLSAVVAHGNRVYYVDLCLHLFILLIHIFIIVIQI